MFEFLQPSEKMDQLIEQQEKEQLEAQKKKLLNKFNSESGVLPRYQSFIFEDFQNDSNFQKIKSFSENHKDTTLILSGACGTGKTLAGSLILKKDFLAGKTGRYITLQQLIYQLNGNFSKAETVDPYTRYSLLVLDEVGYGNNEKELTKQADLLFYILNLRYGYMLPTIIITPLAKNDFIKFAGEATKDRLNQAPAYLLNLQGQVIGGKMRKKGNENFKFRMALLTEELKKGPVNLVDISHKMGINGNTFRQFLASATYQLPFYEENINGQTWLKLMPGVKL